AVNKITVYDDGAIEAECGPIPCGTSGETCIDDQVSCKPEAEIFSGMKWAKNGQSLLLRCCSMFVGNKIYVGTDLVTLGSYYTGGPVAEEDKYGNGGPEYDFVANLRTEQGGVRVWVYRVMCASSNPEVKQNFQQLKQGSGNEASPTVSDGRNFAFEKRRQYLLRQLSANHDQIPQNKNNNEANVNTLNPLQYPTQEHNQKHGNKINAEVRLL
uniref:Uncharacterized protein n=1 Tax=Acrobeloides nanus TaxID=290746 RepID=A0A914ELY6_9BILA